MAIHMYNDHFEFRMLPTSLATLPFWNIRLYSILGFLGNHALLLLHAHSIYCLTDLLPHTQADIQRAFADYDPPM